MVKDDQTVIEYVELLWDDLQVPNWLQGIQ